MKCPKCLFQNPDNTSFCGRCGTRFQSLEGIHEATTKTYHLILGEPIPGALFAGRYQIIEELGQGGMGRVFRAFDKKLKEEVALKLIKTDIASDKDTVERFSRELKIARRIIHKNIGRVYELMEEEGILFITMEYVPGENLKSFIRRAGRLDMEKAVFIARQVCEGLAEAHKQGIIHRDLKPQNIMIDREGNAKILDFGIARMVKVDGTTETGMVIGTPEYMSLEQFEGKDADQRSDIYSLGAIIYEMLTGRVPFEGETPLKIAWRQKAETPSDPRGSNAQIPESLSRLILKCLEKDREKRCQEAEEVLTELNRIDKEILTKQGKVALRQRGKQSQKQSKSFLVSRILMAVIIALLGVLFVSQLLKKGTSSSGFEGKLKWKNSIAVLPFKDQSQQKDLEPICEGMTEAVIVKLGTIEELKVVPFHTMRRYRETDKSLKEVGKELGVETILASSLQKEGKKILMNTQLIKAREDFVIWSRSYEEEFNSFFEVQNSISKMIAKTLELRFVKKRFEAMKKREAKNPEAYKAYIRGRHFERKYADFHEPQDFKEAVANYGRAIDIQKNYALAYWGLGNVFQTRFVEGKDRNDFDFMVDNYAQAYETDPDLAEANAGLGWASFYQGNWDDAYRYYKKAVDLDPNNPEVYFHVAAFLRDIGLYRRAIEYYSRALEIDPVSTEYLRLCARCYMYSGEFEKAASLLKEAIDIEPNDVELHLFYARQLIMMKKYEEAEEEIARAENLEPDNSSVQYPQALVLAARGEKEKALAIIKNIDPIFYTPLVSSVYAILGMKDEALENIQKAIEEGFRELKTYPYSYLILDKNHFYDRLRQDSRFQKIIQEEEAKYREKLKRYGDL